MRIRMQEWGTGFDRLTGRIRQMLDEMRGPNYFCSHSRPFWSPRVNLYETPTHVIACVDLAGIRTEDIELRLCGDVLQLEGTRSRPVLPPEVSEACATDELSVHMVEIDSGRFCRGINLPCEVCAERTVASYRQGFLWIIAPRQAMEE